MPNILKTNLHPEGDNSTTLYPKTSADQVEGLSEAILAQLPPNAGIANIEFVSSEVRDDLTVSTIKVTLLDGDTKEFEVVATNGEKGADGLDGTNGLNGTDGNGIVSIHTIGHTTIGDEEVTTIEVAYTEEQPQTFEVHAKNGNGSNQISIVSIHEGDIPESGTFTPEQLDLLFPVDNNHLSAIAFLDNHEMYYLQTADYDVDYPLIFTCVKRNAIGEFITKVIEVEGSSGEWELYTRVQQKQLYMHNIVFGNGKGNTVIVCDVNRAFTYDTLAEWIINNLGSYETVRNAIPATGGFNTGDMIVAGLGARYNENLLKNQLRVILRPLTNAGTGAYTTGTDSEITDTIIKL